MKRINKIKSSYFSRGLSLTKIAIKTGHSIWKTRDQGLKNIIQSSLESRAEYLTHELNTLKGSLMKAGQMLSLYAGPFLSPEIRKTLESLESQSYFLKWDEIKKEIPKNWKNELKIEKVPLAAASLGQVHIAHDLSTNQKMAMKIQYKGVRKAITRDVLALKKLISIMKLLPKGINFDGVYEEIKEMLLQETDYLKEAKYTKISKLNIGGLPQFEVPSVIEKFSNQKIITTSFIEGYSIRSPEIQQLEKERRNKLGYHFLELFFLELFKWGSFQTDAHPGNYLIQTETAKHPDRWVLIDFGANKTVSNTFLQNYQNLLKSCIYQDRELYFETVYQIGYFPKNGKINKDLLWDYCKLISTPFQSDNYNWGSSNLPEETLKFIPKLMKETAITAPPREAIFIDKKIAGVFFILKLLRSSFNARELFEKYAQD